MPFERVCAISAISPLLDKSVSYIQYSYMKLNFTHASNTSALFSINVKHFVRYNCKFKFLQNEQEFCSSYINNGILLQNVCLLLCLHAYAHSQ